MDYNDIDDVELITLLEENDENVRNIIYDKYSYLVDILIKKYQRAIRYYRINYDEIKKQRDKEKSEKNLQKAVINIKSKYGKNAILKGMNFVEGGTTIERNSQIGGHKS